MSADIILNYLGQCDKNRKLEFRVVCQCAPVLKGVKVSNLVTIPAGMWSRLKHTLIGSQVVCVPLYLGKDKEVIFLYRYEKMRVHLEREEVRVFLSSFGYLDLSVSGVILRLKKRYQEFAQGQIGFPHELGVILEYPVEDVRGFIRHQGKNCLMARYWKVYSDRERAEETFRQYDLVRERAMQEMISGCPLRQVAVS